VLARGDPAEIKRLYVELGAMLAEAIGDDLDQAPVLSFSDTADVVARLSNGVGGRLLDAGCGPNPLLSIHLGAQPRRTVVALDIALGSARLARDVARRAGVEVLAVVGDLERLPFADDVFDGAVCDDTIEHVPDDGQAVVELGRVLHSGGRMVVATPNRRSAHVLYQKADDLLHRRSRPASQYFAATSHLREYTWSDLERLFSPRFSVVRRMGAGRLDGPRRRFLTRLTRRPPLHRFARTLVVEFRLRPR
jgi:ubiquinone/menaquinone biosynthesis C-methylase UbiE